MEQERETLKQYSPGKLNQTSLSDVRPVPSAGELNETYAQCLILADSLHYVQSWCQPQKPKYMTYYILK